MKIYQKVLAGILAAVIIVPAVSPAVKADAPRVSADEAMYVNLDYYGKTGPISIVKGCSLNGNTQFTDYGAYEKVTNMTNEAKPVLTKDGVQWDLKDTAGRFYYECTPKDNTVNLPWKFDVSYKLNGVPTDPKKLAGASGMVEIDVKAIPNRSAPDYYKNNMLLQVGTAVKMKDNLSVEAPGAQLQSVGDYKMVLFAGLPGEEKTFTIRIGTKSFESIGVVMMMIPGTLEQLQEIKEIKETKDTVQGSMDAISQSANEILGTLESMSGGLSSAKSGLASLDKARSTVSSSKGKVYSNADKALSDLTGIANQTNALVPHLQQSQKMVGDISTTLNATVGNLNTISIYLTDLSASIGAVRSDVNDIRDNLNDMNGNSAKRQKLKTDLAADMQAVKANSLLLKGGLTKLSEATGSLTAKSSGLSTTLDAISKSDTSALTGSTLDYATVNSLKTISGSTKPVLDSLGQVTGTTSAVTGGISSMLSQTDQFLNTGNDAVSAVDAYLNALDSGVNDVDELLKDANKIGSSTKNVIEGSKQVIDSVTALNGILNQYKDGTVDALKDTENLAAGISGGLTDARAFLTSLETLMRTSGGSLDDGTRKTIGGLINVLQQSLDGIGRTSTIKNANNTIKKAVDDKINKYEDENNLLNLDAEAKPVSFTSSQNETPQSLQIVMRTEEISKDMKDDGTRDLETDDPKVGVFERICSVFEKLWSSIASAFSN